MVCETPATALIAHDHRPVNAVPAQVDLAKSDLCGFATTQELAARSDIAQPFPAEPAPKNIHNREHQTEGERQDGNREHQEMQRKHRVFSAKAIETETEHCEEIQPQRKACHFL